MLIEVGESRSEERVRLLFLPRDLVYRDGEVELRRDVPLSPFRLCVPDDLAQVRLGLCNTARDGVLCGCSSQTSFALSLLTAMRVAGARGGDERDAAA